MRVRTVGTDNPVGCLCNALLHSLGVRTTRPGMGVVAKRKRKQQKDWYVPLDGPPQQKGPDLHEIYDRRKAHYTILELRRERDSLLQLNHAQAASIHALLKECRHLEKQMREYDDFADPGDGVVIQNVIHGRIHGKIEGVSIGGITVSENRILNQDHWDKILEYRRSHMTAVQNAVQKWQADLTKVAKCGTIPKQTTFLEWSKEHDDGST